VATDRERQSGAPRVPDELWDEAVVREALASRHMGRVIRAWRTHPFHGRYPIAQDRAAGWVGITQAQLSRIENGPPLTHLDRLIQWARVLHIPADRLWFTLPDETAEELTVTVSEVDAGRLLTGRVLTGRVAAAADADTVEIKPIRRYGAAGPAAEPTVDPAAWLAWRLWQRRIDMRRSAQLARAAGDGLDQLGDQLDAAEVPATMAGRLAVHPYVVLDHGRAAYRFADPSMVDVLVAQRLYTELSTGAGQALSAAQTSYATNLQLGAMVSNDPEALDRLSGWLENGESPVLRVNAASILAKSGAPDPADAVISALRTDPEVRRLYLTAVASRVLELDYAAAEELVDTLAGGSGGTGRPVDRYVVGRLTAELVNPQDAAARWCSAVLLSGLAAGADRIRTALGFAVRQEPCRENLRTFAAVLAGSDPIV
jgi:hypothetical protein